MRPKCGMPIGPTLVLIEGDRATTQHVKRDSRLEHGVRPLSDFAQGTAKDAPTARDRPKVQHPHTGEWHFEHRGQFGSWPQA